jgi:hypothetical protein
VGNRRDRLLAETTAIRSVLRNGALGRLEAGWLAANASTYAFLVVTLVVAYDAGGAFAAGLLGVVRYVPPTLIAPFAGVPATRWRADRVLLGVNLARATSISLTGIVLAIDGAVAAALRAGRSRGRLCGVDAATSHELAALAGTHARGVGRVEHRVERC